MLLLFRLRIFDFFAAMVCMSIYVDYQVPVSPYSSSNKIVTHQDRYVVAEGTWVKSHDAFMDSHINNRLNSFKVICRRENKVCHESLSTIGRYKQGITFLTSEINEYDIFSWTPNVVVYGTRSTCENKIFTIDLNTNTINGISKYADNAPIKGHCVPSKHNSDAVTYVREDGDKVFRQEQDKVRPWLMRVVFSVFR